jgi:hypothetical protein
MQRRAKATPPVNLPNPERSRAEERREDESKDPEDMSLCKVASGSFNEDEPC